MVLGFGRIPGKGSKYKGAVVIGTKEFQVVRDEGMPKEKPIGRYWRGPYGRQM